MISRKRLQEKGLLPYLWGGESWTLGEQLPRPSVPIKRNARKNLRRWRGGKKL